MQDNGREGVSEGDKDLVAVVFAERFEKELRKLRDAGLKQKIMKQIEKIVAEPDIGKPMRYQRQGTREVYVSPLQLSYAYEHDTLYFLDIYHKNEQ